MATIPPAAIISAQRSKMASLFWRVVPTVGVILSRRFHASVPVWTFSRQVMCGPQEKHALGCAWKRRSAGSAYSVAHAGHMGNASIDVAGRS